MIEKQMSPPQREDPEKSHPLWDYFRSSSLFSSENPVRLIVSRTGPSITATIEGFPPTLSVVIPARRNEETYTELSVCVTWQDECLDRLLSLEADPEAVSGGYRCRLCPPAQATLHSNLRTFWEGELLTLFAEWLRETLLPAHALLLWRTLDGGCSWAELVQKIEPDWLSKRNQIASLVAMLPLPASESREK